MRSITSHHSPMSHKEGAMLMSPYKPFIKFSLHIEGELYKTELVLNFGPFIYSTVKVT